MNANNPIARKLPNLDPHTLPSSNRAVLHSSERGMMRSFLAIMAAVLVLAVPSVAEAGWVRTWGASPEPPSPKGGRYPVSPSFNNQTVRQVVRVSVGGTRVRIRLENAYGLAGVRIGEARIGVSDGKGGVLAGTDRALTFGGNPVATIPAGAPMLSDPVPLPVAALSKLAISLYLPEATGQCTCHATGLETAYVSAGNATKAAFMPAESTTIEDRVLLMGVDVDAAPGTRAIVALGDSITDGVGGTTDGDDRWPDFLAERLTKRGGWAVVNEGINGNRLLNPVKGDSALARFDRDVLSVPGAAYVIVFDGVNDLGHSFSFQGASGRFTNADPVTADEMILGYKQLIERAHSAGLKIIGATINPYESSHFWHPAGEAMRQTINAWIRTSKAFDGVIDIDMAVRDSAKPTRYKDGLHAGDYLHGSPAGYKAIADAIDLNMFK